MIMIRYLKGDATNPQTPGKKVIVHICNDVGGWGKGFVMALSEKWAAPEADYREQYKSRAVPGSEFKLGAVRFIEVTPGITVGNLIAQHRLTARNGEPPIRYDALEQCLEKVSAFAAASGRSVHMPRIGTGLAGGKWELIEPIIARALKDCDVFVYDFT